MIRFSTNVLSENSGMLRVSAFFTAVLLAGAGGVRADGSSCSISDIGVGGGYGATSASTVCTFAGFGPANETTFNLWVGPETVAPTFLTFTSLQAGLRVSIFDPNPVTVAAAMPGSVAFGSEGIPFPLTVYIDTSVTSTAGVERSGVLGGDDAVTFTASATETPEPGFYAPLIIGLAGLLFGARLRKGRQNEMRISGLIGAYRRSLPFTAQLS